MIPSLSTKKRFRLNQKQATELKGNRALESKAWFPSEKFFSFFRPYGCLPM